MCTRNLCEADNNYRSIPLLAPPIPNKKHSR